MAMKRFPKVPRETGLYPVIDVDGRLPTIPTDFIGASTITVSVAGEPQQNGCLTDSSGPCHPLLIFPVFDPCPFFLRLGIMILVVTTA